MRTRRSETEICSLWICIHVSECTCHLLWWSLCLSHSPFLLTATDPFYHFFLQGFNIFQRFDQPITFTSNWFLYLCHCFLVSALIPPLTNDAESSKFILTAVSTVTVPKGNRGVNKHQSLTHYAQLRLACPCEPLVCALGYHDHLVVCSSVSVSGPHPQVFRKGSNQKA